MNELYTPLMKSDPVASVVNIPGNTVDGSVVVVTDWVSSGVCVQSDNNYIS